MGFPFGQNTILKFEDSNFYLRLLSGRCHGDFEWSEDNGRFLLDITFRIDDDNDGGGVCAGGGCKQLARDKRNKHT